MATRDPYEVLGVARSASADEIKSAYRRLARQHHPDVNPGDPTAEERFKEIGSAYGVLSDPEKKARFDQYGSTDEAPPTGDFFGGAGVGDLFDMFFGGQAGGGQARRRAGRDGDDLRIDVEIPLIDVLAGVTKPLKFKKDAACGSCRGTGSEGGKAPETCPTCKGQGVVTTMRSTFIGQVRTQAVCGTCQGEGTLTKDPCKACRGKKTIKVDATYTVTIPPGIESGSTIQVPGAGSEGVGAGRSGDLYVVVEVLDDPAFQRQGTNLYTRVDLTYAQAVLGDQMVLQGVDDELSLEIPPGTQPGTSIYLRQKGLPPLHGGRRGDVIVQTNITVPTQISDAEIKLIREIADLRGEAQPKGGDKGGFFGGLFGKKK